MQSTLAGVSAPQHLSGHTHDLLAGFFARSRDTAGVHAVRSPHFGPVAGLGHAAWSAVVLASLTPSQTTRGTAAWTPPTYARSQTSWQSTTVS